MRKLLSLFFDFSALLFSFALVFYLILFLLENIFPGFITNFFDVNFFLIPVIFFGFFAAFSHENEKIEEKAKRNDFILIAGLTVLSFVILFYKTADLGWMGFWISLISSFLIAFISIVLFLPDQEETVDEKIKYAEVNQEQKRVPRLLLSPFGITAFVLSLIILAGGSFFAFSQKKSQPKEKIVKEILTLTEDSVIKSPDKTTLSQIPVLILNGTGKQGIASAMTNFLKENGFGSVIASDADNPNYQDATLQFQENDSSAAAYITFLLLNKYKIINMLPPSNSSQSGIILILGQ